MKWSMFIAFWALSALFAAAEENKETVPWAEVGGWAIAIDTTLGGACFLTTMYEDGTYLRLGFNQKGAAAPVHLVVGNGNWNSLEEGKDYDVSVQLDRSTPWNASATAVDFKPSKALWINVAEAAFVSEFVRKHTIHFSFQGRPVASLRLAGSAAASRELAGCQQSVDQVIGSAPPKSNDPFESKPQTQTTGSDPFAL